MDLPVVMIDGICFGDRVILIALGIDAKGNKHVVGLREGSTEKTQVVKSLLSDLGARGSITALYTVLAEDETNSDPISEEVRGILDGHMVLSRKIAAKNQYPAIDVLGSLSRVMPQIVDEAQMASAGRLRRLMAKFDEIEPLLQMGEYKPGNDPLADEAVEKADAIRAFLSQETGDRWSFDQAVDELRMIADG